MVAGTSGPPESVLDPGIVEQLQALAQAGNAGLLGKLQASFARDTPERLQALRAAVAAGDADAVAFNVHTLKGSAANLGALQVVRLCQQIESLPATAPADSVEPLLAELERGAVRVQVELTRLAEAG
jgi:HPt (histidine-containing phosphotransfer) domain-containing protein